MGNGPYRTDIKMYAEWIPVDQTYSKAEALGKMDEAINKYQSFLHDLLEIYENCDDDVQQILNEKYAASVFKYACPLDISEMLWEVCSWEKN
jgi:hypothetical protein